MFGRAPMKAATATAAVGFSCLCYHTLPHLRYPAELPTLGFNYKDGIQPVMSPRQLELHYSKHHSAYVDKLNTLGKGYEGKTIEEIILATTGINESKVMFNQAAQHFNHSFFWKCLSPGGKPMPKTLENAIAKQFGSVDDFMVSFQQAGVNNFGSGWTWLCVDPQTKELLIDSTSNAGCPLTSGLRPIFTADVWEHAYYKDFENRRADYLKELWQIVDWEFVCHMYERATK
ncbi:iron superoxide dismutase [Leishmania major strain Friedlin]|uniref:Superoxide dismutase n=1 Tax=Leishmania major TaxID=5664 RepID=Q4QIE0_LEIMA|nr:iron superoxide dismutase [Leishmania major strain Friedlin]4F2N_A Chain A, Superoxide dismutase [Leishmania major]4F2N_B Chain B, Superoxide dismutase [Leishmania major]4F2N_C Chain C, Superoxide dismutase [Leishmania major]4F2N_D Chain D, Superoxide dismutase [Leishmania major]4F2N_E Chain E, Superoxide dismutase [Leishmania major]4F2N_F Chain F, Superoxide dismutase [Leishmania major]4F2N_G Chain G, Superoxide dismutase [Leishmania major]4F2N_H Chain H, Superoxide dismutase [Leishmani|eukprot:XP_001681058.1 iron superoxide dismutase [Leishmania major strain Friedlin]